MKKRSLSASLLSAFAALLILLSVYTVFFVTPASADDVYFPDEEQIGDFADTLKPRDTLAPGETEPPAETQKPGETTEKVTEPYAIDYKTEFIFPTGLMLIAALMVFLIALAVVKRREKNNWF